MRDPACQVREVPTGRLLSAPSLARDGSRALAVRPSDGQLLTLDAGGYIREWPLPSAQPASLDAGRILEGAGTAALAAGGRELLAVKDPRDPHQPASFTVHDVATGRVLGQFARRLSGPAMDRTRTHSFAISTQGSRLALSIPMPDRTDVDHVEVWDSATGRWLLSLDRDGLGGGLPNAFHSLPIQAFDARGTRLAIPILLTAPRPDGKAPVARGPAASIVELPSGRLLRTIPADTPVAGFGSLALRPDGKLLALAASEVSASGEWRTRVELRDPDSGQLVRTLRGNLPSAPRLLLIFSPDGRRLAATPTRSSESTRSYAVEVWDLAAGAAPEPLHLDGHVSAVLALAFSADGRRLATAATYHTYFDCEVKLWDLALGRDLVTWARSGGTPVDLAFDPDGHRLRVLLSEVYTKDAWVVLLDASPLAPEVEAIDLVDRLAADMPLNSELAEKIQAEPGLDPAVRAAALAVVPLRRENGARLRTRALTWLVLDAAGRTPELMRRALAHAEHAHALAADMDDLDLTILGEARYRNGRLAECLEPLRQFLALQKQANLAVQTWQYYRALAFIAMAEAKLGHRALAQAALDDYHTRRARESAGSKAQPPEDTLLVEAETVFREAFGVPPAAVPTPH
jgi:WD40 repeat protein